VDQSGAWATWNMTGGATLALYVVGKSVFINLIY
jgi:hypothetical protein